MTGGNSSHWGKEKVLESISIRIRFGAAHRQVKGMREKFFPLRMAQGSLMEIGPLQKLSKRSLEDINVVCSCVW